MMSKKKKEFLPKDMDDLEKMVYGPNKDGRNIDSYRLKQYKDWLQSEDFSARLEQETRTIFSPLGEVVKIKENKAKSTFDFRIDSVEVLVETTSIDVYSNTLLQFKSRTEGEQYRLSKTREAIDHVLKKDPSPYSRYLRGGIIFFSVLSDFFINYGDWLKTDPVELRKMFPISLDYLAFAYQPSHTVKHTKEGAIEVKYPTMFYVKDKTVAKKLEKLLIENNCVVRIVN